MRALFLKSGKLFFDKEHTKIVPISNPAYEVIKAIRIPQNLHDIVVYEQTLENASNGLMFVGIDSKGRKQYFYGKNHVKSRNEKRNKIFVQVFRVINKIHEFIDKHLKSKHGYTDTKTQLAVFMLMETSFFIRMGKLRYLKDNDTVGLMTLQNKHIIQERSRLIIRFVGKKCVSHEFIVRKSDRLYAPLMNLVNKDLPDSFIFNKLNERKIYDFINQFGIRIKDLRTYGVNYTFLYNFWSNVQSLSPLPSTKKLINMSLTQTADTVGHTPAMSKNAYMAKTILDMVIDNSILDIIRESTFDDFLLHVVEYVNNTNTV
ncbi:DNA topoisomerase type I [Sea otter poxvirus]|uniref:DNA topoisomerase n=1 Tax=Sea otter poxvirus TaxID=1416741 RepID=A0A2U9QHN8_9POXV|nr:DNA topoisomerase type I [Sea otter poxvirus]AWU47120.1 DNA topoisomerase type I [Sea otter poxvirus]